VTFHWFLLRVIGVLHVRWNLSLWLNAYGYSPDISLYTCVDIFSSRCISLPIQQPYLHFLPNISWRFRECGRKNEVIMLWQAWPWVTGHPSRVDVSPSPSGDFVTWVTKVEWRWLCVDLTFGTPSGPTPTLRHSFFKTTQNVSLILHWSLLAIFQRIWKWKAELSSEPKITR